MGEKNEAAINANRLKIYIYALQKIPPSPISLDTVAEPGCTE